MPIAIVPARLASVRFPGKVLADRTGTPLVVHACRRASMSGCIDRVVVATDAEEIRQAVARAGYEAVMTSAEHPNGTARLAEAAGLLGLGEGEIVVNVQGDEPELEPGVIDASVAAMERLGMDMGTAASPLQPEDDPADPAIVKAVLAFGPAGEAGPLVGRIGRAVYFSRAAVPFAREPGEPHVPLLRHVGLYVYRRAFLGEYAAWPESPLERTERLEQLRAVERGVKISAAVVEPSPPGIDTPAQYEAFVARFGLSGG